MTTEQQTECDENISLLLIYKPRAERIKQEIAEMLQEVKNAR